MRTERSWSRLASAVADAEGMWSACSCRYFPDADAHYQRCLARVLESSARTCKPLTGSFVPRCRRLAGTRTFCQNIWDRYRLFPGSVPCHFIENGFRHVKVLKRDARTVEYRDLPFSLAGRRIARQNRTNGSRGCVRPSVSPVAGFVTHSSDRSIQHPSIRAAMRNSSGSCRFMCVSPALRGLSR